MKSIAQRLIKHSEAFFSECIENPSDEEIEYNNELLELDNAFMEMLENMPKQQALEILSLVEEQDHRIKMLQRAEFEYTKGYSDSYIQRAFFEDTGWYYPDPTYKEKKIKDRI